MAKAPKVPKKRSRKEPDNNRVTIPTPPADPLSENERAFLLSYEANGRNATAAYLDVHPTVKRTTAAVEGHKLLRNPKIAKELEADTRERFARLEMKADEALAHISEIARADLADLYDDDGKILPIHLWPTRIRRAVRSFRFDNENRPIVVLHDSMRAAELMGQAGGKLKAGALNVTFDHAKYLGAAPPEE